MKVLINLKAETRTTKDGRQFLVYQTTNNKNEVIKVKFQKVVKNIPTEQGYYICTVDSDYANFTQDFWGKILWVKDTNFVFDKVNKSNSIAEDFEPAN